jgi:osmotically-inducible protein OsmY
MNNLNNNHEPADERIKEEVNYLLAHSTLVDATDVEVDVQNGWVILKGLVSDRAQKKAAESIAEKVEGVEDVLNYINLRKDRGLIGEMSIKANMI